jgi:hypothetical protein
MWAHEAQWSVGNDWAGCEVAGIRGVGLPEVPEGFARQRVFGPALALYRRVK